MNSACRRDASRPFSLFMSSCYHEFRFADLRFRFADLRFRFADLRFRFADLRFRFADLRFRFADLRFHEFRRIAHNHQDNKDSFRNSF